MNRKNHLITKICVICEKKFETVYSLALVCGSECRRKINIKRAQKNYKLKYKPKIKTCVVCSQNFQTTKNAGITKTCSKECSANWRRLQNQKRKALMLKTSEEYRERTKKERRRWKDKNMEKCLDDRVRYHHKTRRGLEGELLETSVILAKLKREIKINKELI